MTIPTDNQSLQNGSVRIATVLAIPNVLEKLGYNPSEILSELGLDLSLFSDPDNIIPFGVRSHLIQHCVHKTNCQHFGFLIGQQAGPSTLGLAGFLMQQSPDVGTALHSLVRYAHLHVRGALIYLEEQDDKVFLGYSIYQPRVEATAQLEDGALAIAFNIMRKLCGSTWLPLNVFFTRQMPENISPYNDFFNAPLNFDADRNGLSFSAKWMKEPIMGADPALNHFLQKQVNQLESSYDGDFVSQVRKALHSALLAQRGNVSHIAALFSMHPRTLSRRLKSCGVSFQELLDQSGYEVSQQLLENSSMGISQIAATLDYSDASAFTRAFKRWSGMTPANWRKKSKVQQHPIL